MSRPYTRYCETALRLMGDRIKLERKQRHWSEKELASRAGIARATLQRIESGDPTCAIGLVFEAAALVGIPLFDGDERELQRSTREAEKQIALLPKHIYPARSRVDDDF